MADEKKGPPKSAAPASKGWHPLEIIVFLIFITSAIGAIVANFTSYIAHNDVTFFGISISGFIGFFTGQSIIFKIISIFVSGSAIIGTVALSVMKGEIIMAEKAKLFPAGEPEITGGVAPVMDEVKYRWEIIKANSESKNESAWRIAIIDADVLLDELLDRLELPGETMSDKLKAVEKSDFTTINLAWDAHKVRNDIAHGGQNYQLNQREVRRVISLYEAIFKEFYLI